MGNHLVKLITFGIVGAAAAYPFIQQTPQASVQVEKTIPAQIMEVKKQPALTTNSNLPDFASIKDVKQKKRQFFSFLQPFVDEINREISQQRTFVESLHQWPSESVKQQKLKYLIKKYRIKPNNNFVVIKEKLLSRVDILPVELVLMQAANESAWGTSRFAIQANNLFGQWCFKQGCGVIPEGRPEGKTYEVRKFEQPKDSIRSYFHNLNTGYAYEELRTLRKTFREINEQPDPHVLAEGLIPYSTRREAYVIEIQNMIRVNKKYLSTI